MADPKRSICRSKLVHVLLCKKHPKHRQAPGVCSICLSEKLSRLSTSSSRSTTTNTTTSSCSSSPSSSLSSYYSSSCASSCSSPIINREYWEGKLGSSFSFLRSGGKNNRKNNNVLGKSRSMAFVTRMRGGGERNYEGRGSKKGGFWSKLIRGTRRGKRTTTANEAVLMHSRTMREMVNTTTTMVH